MLKSTQCGQLSLKFRFGSKLTSFYIDSEVKYGNVSSMRLGSTFCTLVGDNDAVYGNMSNLSLTKNRIVHNDRFVLAVHSDSADVRVMAPVGPIQIAENRNHIVIIYLHNKLKLS